MSSIYYEHAGIKVILGDCREIAPTLEAKDVALVHADPPYGINYITRARGAGRTVGRCKTPMRERAYAPILGDDEPFDPLHLMRFSRLVLWGANHYADKLPPSSSWIFWDKREDTGPDTNGDGELAWSNLGGPIRTFRHLWRGTCRASETGVPHLYATQKPVKLSTYVFQRAKLKAGDLVFVPYLGSGPDLVAAREMGLRVLACDLSEEACAIAVARLRQETLPIFGAP